MSTSFFRKRKKTVVVAVAVFAGLALVGSTLIGAGGGILGALGGEGTVPQQEDEIRREIENYQQMVEEDPDEIVNWLTLGNIQVQAGNYYIQEGNEEKAMDYFSDAKESFKGALELDEENVEALSSKSLASMYLNDMETAKEKIEKAYEVNPDNPQTLEIYSYVHLQMGETEESIEKLEEILAMEDLNEEERNYYEQQLERQKSMIEQMEREMEKMEELKEIEEEE